ncbi:MAG: PAS domain S-box protein [Anaerolineales bacterium]|nr:PAS domain S-box protein [Anaerolineales bacterium]
MNKSANQHHIDATLLKRLLQATAVSLLLACVYMLLHRNFGLYDLGIALVYALLLALGFGQLHKNEVSWVAHGYTAVFWLSLTLYFLVYGISFSPRPAIYAIPILMTLILLKNRRAMLTYFFMSVAVATLMVNGKQMGWLPLLTTDGKNSTGLFHNLSQAFLILSLLGVSYFLLRFILDTMKLNEQVFRQVQHTLGQRTADLSATNDQLRREIEERQLAEANLEQQQAFLRGIIDTIPNYVFVKDKDGRYIIVNKALADSYKTATAAIEGKTVRDFNPNAQEIALYEAGDQTVLTTQQELYWPEVPFTEMDGSKQWLHVVKRPLLDPISGDLLVLGVSTDITLQKAITESLREKEENFRTLVEASFEGIIICINHEIQEANINFATMFGYTAVTEVLGKKAYDFLATDDVAALQDNMTKHPKLIMEAEGIRHDQTTFPIELVTHTINYQGQLAQITGYRDITIRKQAEEAEQRAEKLESLSVMAGGLAHDFNNLLVAMMGQMAIAKAKTAPEHSSQENLDKAIQATETAAMLTRQLLAYTGQGHFEIKSIHLNQLINQNLQLFQDSLPPNITFQANFHEPLPPILADGVQIQQIIMNLLLNAAEALGTQPGTITINTTPSLLDDGQLLRWRQHNDDIVPGEYVLLEVSDTGRGMDEATQNRIFDPFFSTKGTGRGLGLAAVMGIVRGHQGSVRVKSKVGQGTTFKFLFPSQKEADVVPETAVPPTPSTAQQNTVLVIDDETPVREAMKDILELEQVPTLLAANGAAGIELFTTHKAQIGLVILDLTMPGMSGMEVFAALRDLEPDAKIILSSGYTEAEVLERLAGAQPTGFLHKPYPLEKVLQIVQKHLSP